MTKLNNIQKDSAQKMMIGLSLMDFDQIVQYFKNMDKDSVENTICLISETGAMDSDSLRRLVVAWPKIKKVKINSGMAHPTDLADLWEWIWEQVQYNVDDLRRTSGVGPNILNLMQVLIGNHLLYPDGTVSIWAQKIIRQILKTKLDIRKKGNILYDEKH